MDVTVLDGAGIRIEERADEEVTHHAGQLMAPVGTRAFNPAFDVTPADLVTAVVTESRTLRPGGELAERVAARIQVVADFPTPGVSFQDLGPLYADPALVRDTATAIWRQFQGRFDCVLALEARGFPIGSAVAQRAGAP